jgi:hypothetical protein
VGSDICPQPFKKNFKNQMPFDKTKAKGSVILKSSKKKSELRVINKANARPTLVDTQIGIQNMKDHRTSAFSCCQEVKCWQT